MKGLEVHMNICYFLLKMRILVKRQQFFACLLHKSLPAVTALFSPATAPKIQRTRATASGFQSACLGDQAAADCPLFAFPFSILNAVVQTAIMLESF